MSKLSDVPDAVDGNGKGERRSERIAGYLFAGHMMKSYMTVIWGQMERYLKHEN